MSRGEHRDPERLRDALRDSRDDDPELSPDKSLPRVLARAHGQGARRRVWDHPVILRLRLMISAHTGTHRRDGK